ACPVSVCFQTSIGGNSSMRILSLSLLLLGAGCHGLGPCKCRECLPPCPPECQEKKEPDCTTYHPRETPPRSPEVTSDPFPPPSPCPPPVEAPPPQVEIRQPPPVHVKIPPQKVVIQSAAAPQALPQQMVQPLPQAAPPQMVMAAPQAV